jgi:dUTPase
MILKVNNNLNKSLKKGLILPPANHGDIGYDLVSASSPRIEGELYKANLYKSIKYIEYDTNIAIEPESDEYNDCKFFSLVYPRSSISNYSLSLCNSVGVIDCGYRDTIKLRFNYLPQPENYFFIESRNGKQKNLLVGIDNTRIYQQGDKIGQIVFAEQIHPRISIDKKHSNSERNKGGFGSTGL